MRNKKLIEIRESEVKALEKEYHELYNAQQNLGYITLAKPLRNGWTKSLVLREDIAKRKDGNVLEEVLFACRYTIWGRDHSHVNKNWKRHLKNNLCIVFPGIELLDYKDYNRLSHKAKRYFIPVEYVWLRWVGYTRRYRCILPKYLFVSMYERSYLTKRKIIDNVIESRMAEINEILLSNKYYSHSWNAWSYRNPWCEKEEYYHFFKSNDEELRNAKILFNKAIKYLKD